ncbi:phospholipid/cholesterol/gamma-HCH transport system substrate-binding protein [Haloechinothrix alba]|uniref:Phospholipid/cholesterol/gamma-HCH transport system substrate-binding protein n=1 Tax=Haloechinothrix alba TaxID=664784 RepID=A0A238VFH5_9PSEU|nr:MCE family protein [Haloechinothrix alba]SNR33142.1 phospholipid/cholesterol/gamma-HCH transport system substrate-binding protein [Haloechinothrix alba]
MRSLTAPLIKGLAFTLVTLLATSLLAITIANRSSGDTVRYSARFSDAIALSSGDDVRMSGVRVGEVEEIRVVDRRVAEVDFAVEADRKLLHSTTATLKFRNLIGQRYIALEHGEGGSGEPMEAGDVIPLERTTPALDLTALFNGFRPLFQALSPEQVNKLSYELIRVLQGEGGTVDGIVRHVRSLTSALAERDEVIGRVVSNLNAVLGEFNERDEEMSRLITTTQELTSALAEDADPIGDAVEGLGVLTESVAGLLDDGRPVVNDSVDALGEFAATLNDNTPEFEAMLDNLPGKYETVGRIASYGSWMNIFLCSASAEGVARPPGGDVPGLSVTEARCR